MRFTVTNLEEVPDDLAPGVYCCRVEAATWEEVKVRFVPGSEHRPGDCLFQLAKEDPEVPMVCTACRKPVKRIPAIGPSPASWLHNFDDALDCPVPADQPITAMVAAGNENVPRT